ncbi:MAG: FAD-dependent oxidoreductase [Chloroflexi bacterium]|nr:MAG: FAD-dependent oxidoreductase [Chloroflexota bacterium]
MDRRPVTPAPVVAVVGAGLAGLAAGVELQRRGARVTLIERSRLLGGKATSFVVDGVEVDNGQHVVLRCCTEFLDFVDTLGLADSLRFQSRFVVTVLAREGRPARLSAAPLPAPLHLALGFAGYRHLGIADKLRVARALVAARRPVPDGVDMATWLRMNKQSRAARRAFWDPFLVPALNASLEDVSAGDALFVIRTAFLGKRDAACIGYSTTPLARIAELAAKQLESVRLRSAVTNLHIEQGRVVAVQLEGGERIACDACVLAVPPRRLAAILDTPERYGVTGLGVFRTTPIVDVHLWYDRSPRGLDFAALLDSPVQWVFAKGQGYLCCSLSAAGDLVSRPERALVDLCDAELRAIIPGLRTATLLRGAATRDPEATFLPAPGLQRPGAVTGIANLAIAGAWTDTGWPATMESAVRSGRAAAAHLRAELARRPSSAPARDTDREVAHAI